MKRTMNLLLLTVLALILAACGGQETTLVVQAPPVDSEAVIAEGHLVPRDDLTLAFTATGKIAEILVKKGDTVRSGELLMQLGDRGAAEAGVASAQLELVSAQQAYDELVRTEDLGRAEAWQAFMDAQVARAEAERDWENLNVDNIEDRIDDRQADVNDRKEDLDDAQVEFDKYKDLEKDNSKRRTAKDELERAQENYNEAVRDLEQETRERDTDRAALDQALGIEAEAKHQYELSAKGPNTEKLALYEARLNDAKAQLAAAEDALANYDLKAPFDGVVMDVDVSINEMVGPDKAAVVVADTSQWYVETSDLTELEVVKVAEGQTVTFTADALTDSTMRGVVEQISQTYTLQGGDVLYTVRIRVEDVDPRLRWGMTVEVTFAPLE
jgi:multidrug efflux pump subunit AcrA (membrane-fusion protein)